MLMVNIDKNNGIMAMTRDDGVQFAMTMTSLKHYHNKVEISTHFKVIDDELVDYGELMTVFKYNRQHKITRSLITSC